MYAGHENAQALIPHVVFATLVEHVRSGLLLLILDNKLTRYVLGDVDVLNRNCRVGFYESLGHGIDRALISTLKLLLIRFVSE